MKSFTLFSLIVVAAAGSERPLVSVARLTDLVTDSVALTVDLAKFGSAKLEESLTDQPKEIYAHFTRQVVSYKKMVAEAYAASPISGVVKKTLGMAYAAATERYNRINALSARIVDPLVSDFETRFPASKGFVGPSIADRVLLGLWLVWFIKRALRLALAVFTSAPRRTKA